MSSVGQLVDIPSVLSDAYLPYKPTLRQRQKTYAFSKNSYVQKISITVGENSGERHVSAKIFRSQRKTEAPHTVNMTVNSLTKTLTEGHCSCKAGISGECAHLLAVIMTLQNWILEGYKDIPANPSCTSLPQQWDKPRGEKVQGEPVTQMIIVKPINLNRKRKPLVASFHDNGKKKLQATDLQYLQNLKDCPIAYLTQSKNDVAVQTPHGPQLVGSGLSYHSPLINLDDIRPAVGTHNACGTLEFPLDKDINMPQDAKQFEHEWNEIKCDMSLSKEIEKETRDQAGSSRWQKERSCRITASNFGKIMNRKSQITQKFLKSMFQKQTFFSKATTYGTVNEKAAKIMYARRTNNHVHDIGLIVNQHLPFLGATPDGKVCDTGESGILEIKCPYSARDMTLQEASIGRDFHLTQDGDKLVLKENHNYWFQVQGQLMLTGSPFCDFVTYTRRDFNIQRIYPDYNTQQDMVSKLSSVYAHYVKPFLQQTKV